MTDYEAAKLDWIMRNLSYLTPTNEGAGLISSPALVYDTFTYGGGDTRLDAHVPEVYPGDLWTEYQGTWEIVGNAAVCTASAGDGQNVAAIEAGENNVTVESVYEQVGTPNIGLIANLVDNSNYWLLSLIGTDVIIYERTGGGFIQRSSGGTWTPPGAGNTVALKAVTSDDEITFYVNDVEVASFSDGGRSHQAATRHGVRNHPAVNERFLDFEVTL